MGAAVAWGAGLGVVLGVWGALIWSLRKAEGAVASLVLAVAALVPIGYFSGAEIWRWATPATLARANGWISGADQEIAAAVTIVAVGAVVLLLLIRLGAVHWLTARASTGGD